MAEQPQSRTPRDPELDKEVNEALGQMSVEELMDANQPHAPSSAPSSEHTQAEQDAEQDERPLRLGTIAAVRGDDVFIDLGGKDQGVVPLAQFEKTPRVGEHMEFIPETFLEDEGMYKLSRQGAVAKASWRTLERGMIVEGPVIGVNTGGLEVKIANQRAFMPASQIDLHHVEDFTSFLNHKVQGQVVELNKRKKKIVLSRRAVLEAEQDRRREQVMQTLEEGEIREGTVRNIRQFGAFIDLGGVDGLAHVSDLSYERVKKPEDVVSVGQQVQARVLKVDKEAGRISLGLKQVEPDPWERVQTRYPPGEPVSGRVTKLANFGVFVQLEPGVEGLIPIGELSWERVGKPSDVLSVNQSVKVMVMDVDAPKRRISLSVRKLTGDPWEQADRKYMPGAVITGTVTRTVPFGAFVQLEPGIEGLIHISQLAPKRVERVEDVASVGQEVQAKVRDMDPDKRRIDLSIRALSEEQDAGAKGSRQDVAQRVSQDSKEARAGQSLGSLMDKFGQGGGGLKGGLG